MPRNRQNLIEVSVPKTTIDRYSRFIVEKSILLVNSKALFYVEEKHLSEFLKLKNTKKTR